MIGEYHTYCKQSETDTCSKWVGYCYKCSFPLLVFLANGQLLVCLRIIHIHLCMYSETCLNLNLLGMNFCVRNRHGFCFYMLNKPKYSALAFYLFYSWLDMFHDVYNTNTNKSQNIWTSFELFVVQSNSSLITHRKRKVVQAQTYVLTRIYERSRLSDKYYTEISITTTMF